ncbi:MAG: metal-dependent hydrolase [Pseudomonadota bacterium]
MSEHSIQVRRLADPPSATTPRYWHSDDPFLTHFFNALSSTFPEGERFFIRSVRHYHKQLPAELAEQVDQFTGQEGQHSREHDHHMQLLYDQGYEFLARFNRMQKNVMSWLNTRAPRLSLALTTAIEHVTAIFAHEILRDPDFWLAGMSPDMQRLWRWHAVEEAEHKAVAYDVYQLTIGRLWLRRIAMLDATVGFLMEIFVRHSLLLIKDRQFKPSVLSRGFRQLLGRGGYLRRLAPHLLAYYKDDFHPWQQDNSALLDERRLAWELP